ncbi:ABC transporter permease [Pendulispora albinea]|uniref:ABC-2 family transporter protein n=1 Tax=Pendulispora albinea TaxID=2741071 RepID=A0ABZ2MBK8_9BACT
MAARHRALCGVRRLIVRRYLHLLRIQVRTSTLLGLQYRLDFVFDGLIELFWALTAIVPLFIVFEARESVAGWTFGESLLVVAWFTLLTGVLEGAINPSLAVVVEHIRKGTLDFVLLKPADAQFLVSTARFQPWRAINVVTASILFGYAFARIGHGPSVSGILGSLALLAASVTILYSLGILTVSGAFYVVKIDNLSALFLSIFDAARWPSAVFHGVLRLVFTFVIPLAVMTTYPSLALLDKLPAQTYTLSFGVAVAFAIGSRFIWMHAIGKYTSAGG